MVSRSTDAVYNDIGLKLRLLIVDVEATKSSNDLQSFLVAVFGK